MERLIHSMKAAGEPTRLRILLVLERSELTVSEICRILGQSQPRISRHLKLLCEAGLLSRHAEGTNAFYRHAPEPYAKQFLSAVRPLIDLDAAVVQADQNELARIRADRSELAARSLVKITRESELLDGRKVPSSEVEQTMLEAVGAEPIDTLLDVGTGTGRVLELFAPRIEAGLGIELSREMLNLARTRLDEAGLDHCTVRSGNAYSLDISAGSVELAVLHHVLHYLDEPARAVDQAARTVANTGQLLIVDFVAHKFEELRSHHAHRRLGFTDGEVTEWCAAAGMSVVDARHLAPPNDLGAPENELLTVSIWVARRTQPHTSNVINFSHRLPPQR
ncbi:MAG: ArsR/SmtB family transcription factor [Acidimicrobiales bacterium]